MKWYHKLRFLLIDILVGSSSYAKNMHLDWYQHRIKISHITYWSNIHTRGNPTLEIKGNNMKLSESRLCGQVITSNSQ